MADRYLLESGSPDGYLLEDGSGVLLIDNTTIEIVNNANATVAYRGSGVYRITKSAGSEGVQDADAVSSVSVAADFVLRVKPITSTNSVFGVSTTPTASSNVLDLARGLTYDASNIYSYEGGAYTSVGTFTFATDYVFLRRIGTTVTLLTGSSTDVNSATLLTTQTALSGAVYFDSTLLSLTDIADVYFYIPDPSAALTGQSVSAAQGSITASLSIALTGLSISVAKGAITAAPSLALTGQTVSIARGSVAPALSLALSGQGIVVARGSVIAAPSLTLTGQTITAAQGALTPALSLALAGQSLTVARGSVTPSVAFALSGQSVSVVQGPVAPALSLAISGQSVAIAQGSLAPAFSLVLSGQSLVAGQGSVTPSSAVPLSGVGVVTNMGTITSGGVSVELTGVSMFLAQGSITAFAAGPEIIFWQPPPLTGRRRSVSRSR